MSTSHPTSRGQRAEHDLGATQIARPFAGLLVGLFLLTVVSVPVVEEWRRFRSGDGAERLVLLELPGAVADAASVARSKGAWAGNLALQEAVGQTEHRLEDESFLRGVLLPPVQSLLLRTLGLGNEQVYPGAEGWLFYRADVDHATGPGFLEASRLIERQRGGDAWEPSVQPDPRIALLELHRDLMARDIKLLVVPTPVKPTLLPERFGRRGGASPARNRSYDRFVDELEAAGLRVFDPSAALASVPEGAYLRTDTHWTPAGLEAVARTLSNELERTFELGPRESSYIERPATVDGQGDLVAMLALPENGSPVPERTEIRVVTDAFGSSWRPRADAAILILGDSFTNVFSDARLGWGSGGGFAERLSYHLSRPVDRIALNAGGAYASREALARELESDDDRLEGKLVVLYQFATRELSFGDWRHVPLPPSGRVEEER